MVRGEMRVRLDTSRPSIPAWILGRNQGPGGSHSRRQPGSRGFLLKIFLSLYSKGNCFCPLYIPGSENSVDRASPSVQMRSMGMRNSASSPLVRKGMAPSELRIRRTTSWWSGPRGFRRRPCWSPNLNRYDERKMNLLHSHGIFPVAVSENMRG